MWYQELPGYVEVVSGYREMTFQNRKASEALTAAVSVEAISLPAPGRTSFAGLTIETKLLQAEKCDFDSFKAEDDPCLEWFDFDKLALPMKVRYRKPGDRFHPLGAPGEKKLGKFLTALHAEHELRKNLIVVTDSEKIVWAGPVRCSELTRITASTKNILQIRLSR